METKKEYTFTKEERLCSKKQISALFAGGAKSFSIYPIRVVYMPVEKREGQSAEVSVLISVSKRYFKRAVKRNRVKRQIREAYRLQKADLLQTMHNKDQGIAMAFIYLSNRIVPTAEIMGKMNTALSRLAEAFQ